MNFPRDFRRGFALVTVLAFLALVVVLIISFLGRATTERSAAAGSLHAASSRQLADTAVNLVQGQINLATSRGSDVAWTSQPGMVRTFDQHGNPLLAYKLYSASSMVSGSADYSKDLDNDWNGKPAIWTDLNAPVTDGAGVKNYPILNDQANAVGYRVTGAPVTAGTNANPVPMPVRWLYMLKDGTLVAPSESGTMVTISDESYTGGPNSVNGNPVVGRIAFWTDDETCKVNINTASEGTYWDTPRLNTNQDWAYGNYQPAQHEFQAYPGHPATVSLSTVFPDLTYDQIFKIAPRLIGGGSYGGTQVAGGVLTTDKDRLYADIDELVFDTDRTAKNGLDKAGLEKARFFITAHSRAPEVNLFNLPRIACWPEFEGLATNRVTAFDKLIAFCSTVNGSPYYFQRNQAASPTNDIGIPRNRDLYAYLQYLTGNEIPGFGGTFLAKYPKDRDQILTEIFDYIRSSNLYDDNLDAPNQFTPGRNKDTLVTPQIGHGWVAPTVYNDTVGFGRSVTLSEMGIAFICNAMADDPTTPGTDESADSNFTSGTNANAVLGKTPLLPGERYIQAILIPEFFCAAQGYTVIRPAYSVKISGLSSLKVTVGNDQPQNLFPELTLEDGSVMPMDEATAAYSAAPNFPSAGRAVGGTLDWRCSLMSSKSTRTQWASSDDSKGSPGRGNLTGDNSNTADLYPFIGKPVIIKAPTNGGTMKFRGTLKVKIYAGASTPTEEKNLVQTINIEFPEAEVPVPNIVTGPFAHDPNATTYDKTTKEQWWTFQKAGCVANNAGRLSFSGTSMGQPSAGFQAAGQFLRWDFDIIRSVLPKHGDYRVIAGTKEVPGTVFVPRLKYYDKTVRYLSNLSGPYSWNAVFNDRTGKYFSDITPADEYKPDIPPTNETTLQERPESTGDVDCGMASYPDGPFINKPDEGNNWRGTVADPTIPYKDANWTQVPGGTTQFSPNRQVPSPGMFGSLPTGVQAGTPWQTLLFRPQPGHPQSVKSRPGQPPDHLILDLFWMPVVEPYAISDRFSTAGKINMNYQIVPFTYIERSTGLRALFKSEKIVAVPSNTKWTSYKKYPNLPQNDIFRLNVDGTATLRQFEAKFKDGDVYKSPSEICDIWIVPEGKGLTYENMESFWTTQKLTGDNLRERIYTTLYPRLTTKSNTFTVHFRAQALKKNPSSPAGVWTEGKDMITGEYRGSTTIERFIDPNNTEIKDYAATPSLIPSMNTLDHFYKWRVISNRQFAP